MYANKRYEEARKVLKAIAKFNKASITPFEIDQITFDTEDSYELELKANNDDSDSEVPTAKNDHINLLNARPMIQESSHLSTLVKDDVEVIKLNGTSLKELCSVWQIRRNFLVFMYLLSMNSFCFFLINFQMKFV